MRHPRRRPPTRSRSSSGVRPPCSPADYRAVPASAGPARRPLGWIALIVFLFLAGVGIIGALAAVGVYTSLASQDLPDPRRSTNDPARPSSRSSTTGPARSSWRGSATSQPRGRHLRPDPAGPARRHHRGRGQDVLGERRLRPGRHRLRRRSTPSAATAAAPRRSPSSSSAQRLLDPDARPGPEPDGRAQAQGDHPVDPRDPGLPGRGGQADDHHRLPQPELLRQPELRREGRREELLRGRPLDELTLAQAAILAGAARSRRRTTTSCATPSRSARDASPRTATARPARAQLVVPPTTRRSSQRRNQSSTCSRRRRTPMTGDTVHGRRLRGRQARRRSCSRSQATPQLDGAALRVGGPRRADRRSCAAPTPRPARHSSSGGLRITTTLDMRLQKIAEKWVKAAAIVPAREEPARPRPRRSASALPAWMDNLRRQEPPQRRARRDRLPDRRARRLRRLGRLLRDRRRRKKFQPQFDVLGNGWRQPGSAFKPFNYVDRHRRQEASPPASMFMDVATDFGGGYTPNDADNLERGPVRVRNALQFSLNIPAVKAMARQRHRPRVRQGQGVRDAVPERHVERRPGARPRRRRRSARSTWSRPTARSANGGKHDRPHHDPHDQGQRPARTSIEPYVSRRAGTQVVSPQAAYIVTDILAGNTNPNVNPFWGKFAINDADGRRPATLKTGTNNDAKDLNAYGYIAPPDRSRAATTARTPSRSGVWNGNSTTRLVSTPASPSSRSTSRPTSGRASWSEATQDWPITRLRAGRTASSQVAIDPWTGLLAEPGRRSRSTNGSSPAPSPRARSRRDTCGVDVLVPTSGSRTGTTTG